MRIFSSLYNRLNINSLSILTKYGNLYLPPWITADFVTSSRLSLTFPTTLLLSNGYTYLPATLVMINATFDYVDGALARWEKTDTIRKRTLSDYKKQLIIYDIPLKQIAYKKNWGAYYDALADKLFALPIWCAICGSSDLLWIQLGVLSHVSIESISAYFRTKSYFSSPESSSEIVTAKITGKVKQAISMIGTSLVMIPDVSLVGGCLLWASLPFSILSLKDKLPSSKTQNKESNILVIFHNGITGKEIVKLNKLSIEFPQKVIIVGVTNELDKQSCLLFDFIKGVVLMDKIEDGNMKWKHVQQVQPNQVFVMDQQELEKIHDQELRNITKVLE